MNKIPDFVLLRNEVTRCLCKFVPTQYRVNVTDHPQIPGWLMVDLGDGTPICPVSGFLFATWLLSDAASYAEMQRIFCKKTGKGKQLNLDL